MNCGPRGLPGEADLLFRNEGGGRFTDVSAPAGAADPERHYGLGAGAPGLTRVALSGNQRAGLLTQASVLTTTSLPNDNGIGGTIGEAHYNLWRTHFGQSTGSGTISHATVPEPASGLPLILASIVACCTQRRIAPRVP